MPQNPPALFGQNASKALVPVAANYAGELHVQTGGRQLFMGANSAGVTTSAALATTYVGICLSNPAGNVSGGLPVNFVIRHVGCVTTVAPGAILAVGLITGYAAGGITAHTTALTPFSGQIGTGPTTTAKLDSACTLVGTPVWTRFLASNTTTSYNASFSIDLNGGITIPPGGYIAIGTSVAGPASGFWGSMSWEEVVT